MCGQRGKLPDAAFKLISKNNLLKKFKYALIFIRTGTIVRKLPRKLEVLEGENAAFCVEVENDDMEVHWFKDGLKLHETHQTILKSFGKTHILVFVNVAYHDSGVVTFVTGRSKTSSRLKVKGNLANTLCKCLLRLFCLDLKKL